MSPNRDCIRHEAVCAAILRALGYQPAGLLYGGLAKRQLQVGRKGESFMSYT